MVFYLLSRANFMTFVVLILFCHKSDAFLKQIFGAALMGDAGAAAISSITCASLGDNFTRFKFYTRQKPNETFIVSTRNASQLHKTGFNASIPIKVIIHGFLDSNYLSDWMMEMKNVLLLEGNYNIIIMDWSCANGFPYFKAVRNAKIAATHLHRLLIFLKDQGANFTDMHLIGHSLGSQIAGIVGTKINKLGRISGLDPAGPMFYDVDVQERLDPTDALFVDVIHTDGGTNLFEGLGLAKHSGHVDFYPNGGQIQPGCHSSPLDVIERFGFKRTARYYLSCDHFRAINFYIDSIKQEISIRRGENKCQYVGVKCPDWEAFTKGRCADCSNPENCAIMGYNSNKYLRKNGSIENVFFLKTSDDEPYCVYQYRVTMETGSRRVLRKNLHSYNYTYDVINLELVNTDGDRITIRLNERREDYLKAKSKYSYLVMTNNRIRGVKSASLWFGAEGKPQTKISKTKLKLGIRVRKIGILPIEAYNINKISRVSKIKLKKIVLCGGEDNILTRGEIVNLSVNC